MKHMKLRLSYVGVFVLFVCVCLAAEARAEKKYGPGVTDTEILIGQTQPYSGPVSYLSVIGRAEAAYFKKINDEGGVNGRKIRLISLDDGYNPSKTVEQTRRLVEQDEVLLIFGSVGTPTNTAIHKYLNLKKVPQLFPTGGATKWGDPENFPWTMAWAPSYQFEAKVYAKYIMETKPDAKIAILYQNDDYGKDYLKGFKEALGSKTEKLIIAEMPYETSYPTIDSQITQLYSSGADVLLDISTSKFSAQAIRQMYNLQWRPLHILNSPSASVGATFRPVGLEKAAGIISSLFAIDPTDPTYHQTKGYRDWIEWMKEYQPNADVNDVFNVYGYSVAQTLVKILEQCGDDLTRQNVMHQAANLKDVQLPMLLPGLKLNTSATNFFPMHQLQLMRFDGKKWVSFGELIQE